jgi:SPX domain protein involved in polyphosphate accumulation
VLIFKRKKFYEDESLDVNDSELLSNWVQSALDSSQITSVYLDSDEMIHYHKRIERKEGAQLFRFRWYGKKKDDHHIVFPERKTHHESWTTDTSTKERVSIKWKHVSKYMTGEWNIEKFVEKQFREGRITKKDAEKQIELSKQIQDSILDEKLKPVVRTAYSRSAFQLSSSNAVRISIDTDLTFNNEDLPKKDWCLKQPEVELVFPYAVFEVKLQDESPLWLQELLQSYEKRNAIVPVYKFSKFLQSCVIFHKSKVNILPHWMDTSHEELAPLYEKIQEVEDKIKSAEEKKQESIERERTFNETDSLIQRRISIGQKSQLNENTPLLSNSSRKSINDDNDDDDSHPMRPKEGILSIAVGKIKSWMNPSNPTRKFVPTKIEPKTYSIQTL